MKIVRIIGGLGNQMFQYALYLSLKKKYPQEEVLLDVHLFDSYKLHNGYELERVFLMNPLHANIKQIKSLSFYTSNYFIQRIYRKLHIMKRTECVENKDFVFQPNVFTEKSCYYEGYWQNELYFKDIREHLLNDFVFNLDSIPEDNKQIISDIHNSNSVSIHVRRGDYVNHPSFGGICTLSYYKQAVDCIKNRVVNPKFFLFSNDKEWVLANIVPLLNGSPFIFVDVNTGPYSYVDMYLMSICKHSILANSSFSWWTAYLKHYSKAVVVAPKRWTRQSSDLNIQLSSWTLI